MSRISYVDRSTAPPETAELFARMESNGASVLNLWQMAAHSPATLPYLVRLGNSILSKTNLNPVLRELAILRQAEILGCAYEITAHSMLGKDVGITDEQINALKSWRASKIFNPAERAVLRFTDELIKRGEVSAHTFSATEKFLDPRGIMELTVTIGFYELLSHLLLTFEVDAESGAFTSASQIMGR